MEDHQHLKPDWLSLTSVPIRLLFSETNTLMATATGFFYEFEEKRYFITNWHNVTGRNAITREPISSHGGSPDVMELGLLTSLSPIEFSTFRLPLYDNKKRTGWLVHPIHKEKVDVVALPVSFPKDFVGLANPINKAPLRNDRMEVSDDVFIIGFPLNIYGGALFPIWKRGSVATEPDVDLDGLPKFLIDTATRQGMSGSPVVMRKKGVHIYEQNDDKVTIGLSQNLVGIYSGRIHSNSALDAQLGIVWKARVIEEIIRGNCHCDFTIF